GKAKQESLRTAAPIVARSRPLVRLANDVPLALDWEGWRLKPLDAERLLAMCRDLGFQSLAGQVRALARSSGGATPAPVQAELFTGEELFPFGANTPAAEAPTDPTPADEAPVATHPASPACWRVRTHAGDTAPTP